MALIVPPFSAVVVRGSGRGKELTVPTINLDIADIPFELVEGIYACKAEINGNLLHAVAHYGPRPVFDDSSSFEVHLLDTSIEEVPVTITMHMISYLRDVENFASQEALVTQMKNDCERARVILQTHD